jgi:hypothetical protein
MLKRSGAQARNIIKECNSAVLRRIAIAYKGDRDTVKYQSLTTDI